MRFIVEKEALGSSEVRASDHFYYIQYSVRRVHKENRIYLSRVITDVDTENRDGSVVKLL